MCAWRVLVVNVISPAAAGLQGNLWSVTELKNVAQLAEVRRTDFAHIWFRHNRTKAELRAEFAARAVEGVIHHNEFFIKPLRHLSGLNAGQAGKGCLIAVVVFLDVVDKRHMSFVLFTNR